MLNDFSVAAHVYVACGYTDMRRGIDGLAVIVQQFSSLTRLEACSCFRHAVQQDKGTVLVERWLCAAVLASGARLISVDEGEK